MLRRLLNRWGIAPPVHPLLESYRSEVYRSDEFIYDTPARAFPSGQAILDLPREEQAEIVIQALARMRSLRQEDAMRTLCVALLRRRLPFTDEQIVRLAEETCRQRRSGFYNQPLSGIVRACETFAEENALPGAIRPFLEEIRHRLLPDNALAEWRRLAGRLEALLGAGPDTTALARGDAWADRLLDRLDGMPAGERAAWDELLAHARTAASARPAKRWTETARQLLTEDVRPRFPAAARQCLAAIGEPGSEPSTADDPRLLDERHTDLLRGLIWCTGLLGEATPVAELSAAAAQCFKKIRWIGPLNAKVGNACLWALAAEPSPASVAVLSTLRARVRHPSTRDSIDKALAAAAERLGMDSDEVEEAAVPDFGMDEVGCLRRAVGEYQAVLRLRDSTTVELRWLRPDGKEQKSVPKQVREGSAEEVKALRKLAREIRSALPGQRDRLERLLLSQRSWPLAVWRERYLDHPLVGSLARRLIWVFRLGEETATGIWRDGVMVDSRGAPLGKEHGDSRVSLWHPLDDDEEAIRAWRLWLYTQRVTQPFKQAHREIYLLTDAERQTGTYSNRFAAHILRQHQFVALCQRRGWRYSLQGAWDSHNTPHRVLEEHGLSVEFWVEATPIETSEMGVYLYLASDQVRFCDLEGEPLPLEEVPPLVFSESMRDVDLFVAVASVGNDPNWVEHGDQRFDAYWHDYSFGDLGETAKTRREILERIVPRLGIADRCSLSDRFLVVRGELHSYKVHLGSGNVLIRGSGRYLCIVPGRSGVKWAQRPFLPFEGDSVLSIILSKAFLLAEDDQIEDRTIRAQIRDDH